MTFNHLVLIGGGHSNVSLLKKWLMFPKLMPEIPVSIISRDSHLVYSAMFPSVISKSISLEESLIDIKSLAKNAKLSFIEEEVKDIDFNLKKIALSNRPSVNYSKLVLNYGSQTIIPKEFELLVKNRIAYTIKPFFKAYDLIQKEDIMPLDVYIGKRRELRKNIVDYKKNRRVALGPYATFYFESYETMLAQVQEMLYIEKGGDEQLQDELSAYNPLIPNGKELTATLMFEIDNPISRAAFLGKVGGIEETVFMKINGEKIKAVPEEDVDRTSTEGKASSVQFIHFSFTDDQIEKFKSNSLEIELGIDHKEYSHSTKLSKENIASLSADFN